MKDNSNIELIKSMVQLQKELGTIKKDQTGQKGNRTFSYANLESIWETLQPLLVKNDLWVAQFVETMDGSPHLKSVLSHVGGGHIESSIKIDHVGKEIKEFGASITYYRRYALQAMFCIICVEDSKDEPEVDVEKMTKPIPLKKPHEKEETSPKLNETQIDTLKAQLTSDEIKEWFEELMLKNKISDYSQIEQSKLKGIIGMITDKKEG